MKKTDKEIEVTTSERVRAHGYKRIPRRHLTQPGEVKLSDCKVRVTMYVDADVLEYFKARAAQTNAAPYQTQINNELRAVMEREGGQAGDEPILISATQLAGLLQNDELIAALAARVGKALADRQRKKIA